MKTDLFHRFCREREEIRRRKEQGDSSPWTEDKRLDRYWFPNIRRMDDPTTVWLHGALLCPLTDPEQIILTVVAFRLFGSQETGQALLPMILGPGWDLGLFLEAVGPLGQPFNTRLRLEHRSRSLESAAATVERLLAENGRWPLLRGATLREAHRALCGLPGIGPELAYEMICDLRWTSVLQGASDRRSWALPGRSAVEAAGSLLEREMRSTRHQDREDTIVLMQDLLTESQAEFPDWEIHEVQRALTLFHFWTREKRPTRRYRR